MENDKDWIFSKIPNWLRWILAIPIALIASLIAPIIFSIVNYFYNGTDNSLWINIVRMVVSVGGFLAGIYYCVPKLKEIITGVFGILLSIYFAVMITIWCVRGYYWTTDNVVNFITGIICVVISVHLILKHRDDESV